MKKLAFLLAFGAIFVSSCKKNYTCTCTTSTTIGSNTVTTSTPYIIPDATQQQAATICVAREVYQSGNSQTYHCSL